MKCLAPILCFERGSAEYPVQPPTMAPVSRLDSTAECKPLQEQPQIREGGRGRSFRLTGHGALLSKLPKASELG